MLNVRRIYLYLVAAISLTAVSWAVIGLTRLILSEGIGQGQITALASMLAVIIVGLPIYLFHWLIAQKQAKDNNQEQESPIRQGYFYLIMLVAAVPFISNVYRLVDNGLLGLVGGNRLDYYPYNLTIAEHLAAMLIWAVIWVYHWRFARAYTQTAAPLSLNLGIRRFYLLAFALGGLGMVAWGIYGLLQILMQSLAGMFWVTPVANYSAQLLVGTAIWVGHWFILQQYFHSGQPTEERSVLRKIYLYLNVFVFSVLALGSGTAFLRRFIELALGAPPAEEPLLSQLSTPLPLLIVGSVFWAYHWYILHQDADQAPEIPRQAGVRRLYAYLVAGVGLTVLLTGLVGLLTLLIDLMTSSATVGMVYYRESVATFSAMVIVGLPVWVLPWRTVQTVATQPDTGAPSPESAERRSVVRKIYLYFFVFVASLVIFGSVGWFVFSILTAILGADLPDDFLTQVLSALVIALLAVGVWLYHGWAIRRDGLLSGQEESAQLSDFTVAVIDGDEGALGQVIINQIKRDLPGVQITPIGITPQAQSAMAGQPLSTEAVASAHFIAGSWQILTNTQVAAAIGNGTSTKFAVPLPAENWVWTGVKSQTTHSYAAQITRGLKQAIEGEEITFERETNVGVIVAIVVGVLLFFCIGSSVVSLVLGSF